MGILTNFLPKFKNYFGSKPIDLHRLLLNMTTFFVKVRCLLDNHVKTGLVQVPITDGQDAKVIGENIFFAIKNEMWLHLLDFEIESIQFIHKST